MPDDVFYFDKLAQLRFGELPLELLAAPAGELVQPLHEPRFGESLGGGF